MRRIGILTAGGDTPALNATLYGAVTRANKHRVEMIGFIKGFSSLANPRVPHVHLNPLFSTIPELDPARGGTILGASRDYVDGEDTEAINGIADRLKRLQIDGLICVGGDGTLNGMQALSNSLPTVLAPKTIDNDLGLNTPVEPDEWVRHGPVGGADSRTVPAGATEIGGHWYTRSPSRARFDLDQMVNYVTPGYATAVFVAASGVQRIRTTAESHRRIAIVECMGRHSGYIAMGAMYGRPDLLLVPEYRLDIDTLVHRVREVYDLQKHAVIVCGEGATDEHGNELGAEYGSTDPAGNKILSGASEALRAILIQRLGDSYFVDRRRNESARAAIFTRKIGHTQRGGRPILFDRFYAAQLGGHAVDLLLEGQINAVAALQWNRDRGFHLGQVMANDLRDRWGLIHARQIHPSFFDPVGLRPSQVGIDYLTPIFTNALGADDMEALLGNLFDPASLRIAYHSINTDIHKRIRYLQD
ncbi:6-phosphofructokinase [Fimbriiglobus ruber]|uniref:6-phosphofructokinase n=1 Tax=Fimbriiglobus ruber TaxID=1908690 RepID=A0A225DG82_9BACT|nr:6-phosphofructokinase [Fimbriiglobus ruber]OWK40492.1 6-phosphofructokinase [Fimbriiglobus ruber]